MEKTGGKVEVLRWGGGIVVVERVRLYWGWIKVEWGVREQVEGVHGVTGEVVEMDVCECV